EYSHLHGLIPRLGFFIGHEDRIPYDVNELIGSIAPRPVLVIAPTWDQYASFSDLQGQLREVKKVYDLFKRGDHLELYFPEDYNRFSEEMQLKMINWLTERIKKEK
ncbi:MAG: alpha/beta hydrolase, partial [Saprospiraceae bacterium]|nr:alpha/beta hydrolase [Saprospiraceae bacterium]